jgi:hypothetical protein
MDARNARNTTDDALRRHYVRQLQRAFSRRRNEDTMIALLDLVREAFEAGVTRDDLEGALR